MAQPIPTPKPRGPLRSSGESTPSKLVPSRSSLGTRSSAASKKTFSGGEALSDQPPGFGRIRRRRSLVRAEAHWPRRRVLRRREQSNRTDPHPTTDRNRRWPSLILPIVRMDRGSAVAGRCTPTRRRSKRRRCQPGHHGPLHRHARRRAGAAAPGARDC